MAQIRNFSIIAHIDHGKSTLADRLIQHVGLVEMRLFHDQLLDNMDLEQERGITIKSQTVSLPYTNKKGELFELNLIDTPGHVDFSYEVSRALASCEGALLLVDAAQGVEAQTVANLYAALEHDLEIIPVINKIDLLAADIERVKEEIELELGLDSDRALLCSAKEGLGIGEVFEAIIERIPPPQGNPQESLSALIFDAYYDSFRGTIVSCRVFDGSIRAGDIIRFMYHDVTYRVEEVGIFRLKLEQRKELSAGEVGYLIAGIKNISDIRVGDTVTLDEKPLSKPLAGFKEPRPMVFSSMYPIAADEYSTLVDALAKYKLNDAAFIFQKDSSAALGQGFRCGFLGLLHLEIVQERLEREYDQALIMTAPSVQYKFLLKSGEQVTIDNPQYYPDPTTIDRAEEPYVRLTIFMPARYMGVVMKMCTKRRGLNSQFNYTTPERIELSFDIPLAEIVYDFYDKLKTITQGYGSCDFEYLDHRESDLVKVDILVNHEKVDALSFIVHRDNARPRALHICERLKEEIHRQMFKIIVQGAIGGNIIARSTINPYRKDVTAKCYGGDVTRKRKLLEKQKRGKDRMKMVGAVQIPQKAFVSVLKTKTD
ncbi:translation elongation factor 4 [candidate division CSSED10-310 bacterium]|uniref:Elongation factor 4 n=1 Tax=candidate division CSSED10-310 bacterium TaxID=2855610 RepID=A0ABV6Z457_UNCC1